MVYHVVSGEGRTYSSSYAHQARAWPSSAVANRDQGKPFLRSLIPCCVLDGFQLFKRATVRERWDGSSLGDPAVLQSHSNYTSVVPALRIVNGLNEQ